MQALNATEGDIIEIGDDSDDEDFVRQYVDLDDDENDNPLAFSLDLGGNHTPDLHSQGAAVSNDTVLNQLNNLELCLEKVLEVFPDVCHDHVRQLYNGRAQAAQPTGVVPYNDEVANELIMQILDGGKYPKEKDRKKQLKRKRSQHNIAVDDDAQWTAPDRPRLPLSVYFDQSRVLLQQEFTNVPVKYIDVLLREHNFLFPTYLALELADRMYNDMQEPPYHRVKTPRKPKANQASMQLDPKGYGTTELERELLAARKKRIGDEAERQRKQQMKEADAAEERKCFEKGDVVECQCCFTNTPFPKATNCNGEALHFFCLECARSNANAQIELSRYKITCMDVSGCKAEFSRGQKYRFLDSKALECLDRLQLQDDLRAADIPNFEKCPFCDFGAICPPVNVDREFRCCMPECERTSCRLCKRDSHVPMTCEEFKKEDGVAERHALEEAMTNALIRTCPQCKVAVLKEDGCNKVSCSRCGCVHCDMCGKDITKDAYAHFSDYGPRGKGSGCKVHDDTDKRRRAKVEAAEKETMAQLRAHNPDLKEEDLKIKFSKEVLKGPQRSNLYAMPYGHAAMGMGAAIPGAPPIHGYDVRDRDFLNVVQQNQDDHLKQLRQMRQALQAQQADHARQVHVQQAHAQRARQAWQVRHDQRHANLQTARAAQDEILAQRQASGQQKESAAQLFDDLGPLNAIQDGGQGRRQTEQNRPGVSDPWRPTHPLPPQENLRSNGLHDHTRDGPYNNFGLPDNHGGPWPFNRTATPRGLTGMNNFPARDGYYQYARAELPNYVPFIGELKGEPHERGNPDPR